MKTSNGPLTSIATFALVVVAACAGARGPTAPVAADTIALSRLPDPVDTSSFVDATADLLLPRSDGHCTPESLEEVRRQYEHMFDPSLVGDDYQRVRIALERAYALCANAKLLFNLGIIERQLGDLAPSHALLEAYLVKGEPTADRVASVRKEMAEIDARTGWIAVECGPGVDHVIVDDRDLVALGACPFRRRVRVDRGRHHVRSETTEAFDVEARATVGVSLRLLAGRR